MKIVIISDTHGDVKTLNKIFNSHCYDADMIFHLGDGADEFLDMINLHKHTKIFHMVKGNCDFDPFGKLQTSKLVTIPNGLKIFACHGHAFNVKNSLQSLIDHCKTLNVSLILFGHTHIKFLKFNDSNGIILLNPGSTSFPRKFGPSIGVVSINESKKISAKIIEL